MPLVVIVNVRVDTSWQSEVNSELRQAVAGLAPGDDRRLVRRERRRRACSPTARTRPPAGARVFAAVIARAMHAPHLGGVTH